VGKTRFNQIFKFLNKKLFPEISPLIKLENYKAKWVYTYNYTTIYIMHKQ
jgi:hypothetical protein